MESSKLEVLIPKDTEIDIEDVFTSGDGLDQADPTSLIEQRSLLYFDETLRVYVTLRTPYKNEAHLKSVIARIAISLEVLAYGFQARPSEGPDGYKESSPARSEDMLWSGDINTSESPITVVQEGNEPGLGRHALAIWRSTIPLCRPRMRLQSPMIVFKPSATLGRGKEEHSDKLKDPILPSGVPASINLLESLKGDPSLQGEVPRLPASRLFSVTPQSYDEATSDDTLTINAQKAFRALPAISSRVRYSRSNSYKAKASVIACLDIETAPFSHEDIEITEIDMQLSDGSAENVGNNSLAPILPLTCRAKDIPVFLFCLTPNEALHDSPSLTSARTLLITVHAFVLVSETCHPKIEMQWKTSVDFATALNPTFGAPGQSMQRARRPSSLTRAPTVANNSNFPVSSREADASAKTGADQARERAASVGDLGVSVTFTAPKTVQVGHPFSWDVLVVNRSSKPRQLVLTIIPKRKKAFTAGHLSKASSSSAGPRGDGDIAEAVIDENVLYAMQKMAGHELAGVISLSTDVRVGLLGPDSCLNTELKFLPLARGYLHIEAVRVIDVASNDYIDIRDLPDIVAVG